MDFDGVFTDNRVIVREDGLESVICSRGDGMGIELLRKAGLPMFILSKETNKVVAARAKKLKLDVAHGIEGKLEIFHNWLAEKGVDVAKTVYIGNDVNDLECLRAAGCGVAVADAHPFALEAADFVLSTPGGHGAIRELADMILAQMGKI